MKRFLPGLEVLAFPVIALVMLVCVCLTRPLMPIDETRYVSIAWEMWLQRGWLSPLTMNFMPYDHKPPVLFWMINLFWSVFGVSRWAATMPFVAVSFINLYLTGRIYNLLFPSERSEKAAWIMLGSFPFLMYATLIMFDMTVCLFVQLAVLCLLSFAKDGRWRWIVVMGLSLGLGVLTKGPVVYLYMVFPVLFGPLWNDGIVSKWKWYGAFIVAVLISIPPVLLWLIPVLKAAGSDFAFSLLWHQTIDRITGHTKPVGAEIQSLQVHSRPFYFYLMVLPAMVIPWAFFPQFWNNLRALKFNPAMFFLFFWLVPTFLAFSMISGKQAHYLVPLLPAASMVMTYLLKGAKIKWIIQTVFCMIFLFTGCHVIAAGTIFPKYDMEKIAQGLAPYKNRDIAYVRNYHAELGFTGRLTKKVDDVNRGKLLAWFDTHPNGIAVIRYVRTDKMTGLHQLADYPFRSSRMGIFEREEEP